MTDFRSLLGRALPGARLHAVRPLTGGSSARVSLLEASGPDGRALRLVVREYGARDLQTRPGVAAQEFGVLERLRTAGLPVPRPVYAGAEVLVTSFVEGATEFRPADEGRYVRGLAAFLARLHRLPGAGFPFLPPLAPEAPRSTPPDTALSEGRLRAALAGLQPPTCTPVVLHGDFWPGNVLWQGGQVSAVIDWEDAAVGDPLSDVGTARLELLFFLGRRATHTFTQEYAALAGVTLADLPYWDLRAALRPCGRMGGWGLDADLEARMRRRHAGFVERALGAVGASRC